ncbi:MAG: MBL fold metallo-hydrolase [Candidatus Rokubacteria bacterium]|nr:MBL fold metallo-hydrolase [Candidatus Rokubacteria bacterium]
MDRVSITTLVDNYIDSLRRDEPVARRFSHSVARKMTDLRAEHGLAHLVEISRGASTTRIGFDFGQTDASLNHNVRELGVDVARLDAIALSHGHRDHFGGLMGFLHAHRRFMRKDLVFYAGADHFLPRFHDRDADRIYIGRLDRLEIERYGVRVETVREPRAIADGVLLSGELAAPEPFEPIPESLKVERDGAVVPDTFIGEQTMIANVRDRGLVVVTSCSHRGIVGICRHAVRVTGVPKVHAVVGGFHLSGLSDERVTRVVDAFRELGVDHVVPQHCTGIEAIATLYHRMPGQMVVSSVGTTFTFGT